MIRIIIALTAALTAALTVAHLDHVDARLLARADLHNIPPVSPAGGILIDDPGARTAPRPS